MNWQDIDIEKTTLTDLVTFWAQDRPEKDLLIFEGSHIFDGRVESYSFKKMESLINRFGNALKELGLKKGDRAAIYLPNCPEFIIAYLGIMKIGAVVVPASPIYTKREVMYLLEDTGCKTVITASLLAANIEQEELSKLDSIILLDKHEGFPSFYDLLENAPDSLERAEIDVQNDLAMIAYTSGSTGVPKGVPHTNYEFTWNLRQALLHMEFKDSSAVACTTTPLFHVTGYHDTFGLGLFAGIATVVMERFDPAKFFELVEKHKITYTLVPTAGLIYLLNVPDSDKYDLGSLEGIMSGGAAVPREIGEAMTNKFNIDLVEGYGSTEVLISNVNPRSIRGEIKFGSVGPCLNYSEEVVIKIVDEITGEGEKSLGDLGEILIKSPSVCKSYWNKPEDSAESFKNGFWYSGDIGYIDEQGYLYIVDRKKEMINVSGFKCWPREVEEVIHAHPAVADVSVVARPHPVKEEEPVAFIACKPGETLKPEDMNDYLADKLAKYKIPVDYFFMDALPKTLQGKTKKDELKKIAGESA